MLLKTQLFDQNLGRVCVFTFSQRAAHYYWTWRVASGGLASPPRTPSHWLAPAHEGWPCSSFSGTSLHSIFWILCRHSAPSSAHHLVIVVTCVQKKKRLKLSITLELSSTREQKAISIFSPFFSLSSLIYFSAKRYTHIWKHNQEWETEHYSYYPIWRWPLILNYLQIIFCGHIHI